MSAPDKNEFMEAAALEIKTLEENGTWIEVPFSESEGRVIPGTWTFNVSVHLMERSPVTKLAIVYVVT